MEELIKELINSVEGLNSFSWKDAISILALTSSWITIWFLLKERADSNRPYLQITFELIRSTLACVVLRNTGNVPLTIKKLVFSDDFVKQLPERERRNLEKCSVNNMTIFPGKQWVICLGVIIPEIIEKYDNKVLTINYSYSKINKKKKYYEDTKIDFEQYSGFLVYISEIDELREVNDKMSRDIKELRKDVKKITSTIVGYSNISDTYIKNIVTGYQKDDNQ